MAASRLRLASSSNNPFCKRPVRSLVAAWVMAAKASKITRVQIVGVGLRRALGDGVTFFILIVHQDYRRGRSELSWFCKITCTPFTFHASRLKFVAHAVHGFDPPWGIGVRLDFRTEARDVVVHGARGREGRVTPHHIQKPFTRDGFAC